MNPIVYLLSMLINLYSFAVFVAVILQLLISFKIVNTAHPLVYRVNDFLQRITDPVLKHIRRYVKPINGIDLSPLVLLIGLHFLGYVLIYFFANPFAALPA
jgi:YggT family protein